MNEAPETIEQLLADQLDVRDCEGELIVTLAAHGRPYAQVITVDVVRSGQPRPYADHERVERVTIHRYTYRGLVDVIDDAQDDTATAQHDADEGTDRLNEVIIPDRRAHLVADALRAHVSPREQLSMSLAEELASNRWWHQPAEGVYYPMVDRHSMNSHFQGWVDSVTVIDDYTVEIRSIRPFTD